MSIFTQLYPKNLFLEAFWTTKEHSKLSIRTKPLLKNSFLSFYYNSEFLKDQLIKINSKYLYFYDKDGWIAYVKLRASLISTFIQENPQGTQFGFTIKINSFLKQDFFVGSDKELQVWVKYLKKIAILTNFDEDYVVIKDIDSGRFGSVKLCQSLQSQKSKQYAVKQIEKSDLTELKLIQQLSNEINVLRKFSSKYITKLYRVYEDTSKIYLILEYVPHGNLLKRVLSKKKFSESEVAKFASRLFSVIKYIHSFGIIHRDLKPENILMTSSTKTHKFKIADFGLACYIDRSEKLKSGSPGYMAPEILRGHSYSTKVDIFSGGIILYILLTGTSPFSGLGQNKTIQLNMLCELNFDKGLFKHLSEECIRFLRGVLDAEPVFRPSAVVALQDEWIMKDKVKKIVSQTCETQKGRNGLRGFNRVSSRLIIF